jgi:hypothetical protein
MCAPGTTLWCRPEPRSLILKPATAGSNSAGQLGLGQFEYGGEMGNNLPAVSLSTVGTGVTLTARAISTVYKHTCALLSNGQLKCWGACPIPLFPSRWSGSTPKGAGPLCAGAVVICVLEGCGIEVGFENASQSRRMCGR